MEDGGIHQEELAAGPLRPASDDGDAALVTAVLHKDRKATADFVGRFADEIYAYIRSRLAPHYDQVDDLVQEVFLAAWKSLPQFRGEGPLRAWMGTIARHKVEDYYRRCLRAPESLDEIDPGQGNLEASFDLRDILEQDELRSRTLSVLDDLPPRYRLVLIWRYWERASARDMALKTGRTEKAIERLLARARAEFRERWESGRT